MGAALDQGSELRRARSRFLKAWTDVIAQIGVAVEATRGLVQELDTQAAVAELAHDRREAAAQSVEGRLRALEQEIALLRAGQAAPTAPPLAAASPRSSPPGR